MTSTFTFDELCEQRRAAERRRDDLLPILMAQIEPGAEWPRIGPNHPAVGEFEQLSKEIERLDHEMDRAEASH